MTELNEFLQPLGAPVSSERPVTSFGFDTTADRGMVGGRIIPQYFRGNIAVVDMARENGSLNNIQEAINFVEKLGGGQVYIRPGTYVISETITIPSNISLIGEDQDSVIFNFNFSTTKYISIAGSIGTHKKNIHISNIQFKNSSLTDSGILQFNYCDDVSVTNCKFYNNYGNTTYSYDINFVDVHKGLAQGNYHTETTNPVNLYSSDYISIHYNELENYVTKGIFVDTTDTVFITNNKIFTGVASADGIYGYTANGVKVSNNDINSTNTGRAVVMQTCASVLINNNTTLAPDGNGITLFSDSHNNTVVSNYVTADTATGSGILCENGNNNIVMGNIVAQGFNGVNIASGVTNTTVVGNYLASATNPLADAGTTTNSGLNVV